jgi:hypothetical protein
VYGKLPVIWYQGIWSSHTTGRNFKENFTVMKFFSKTKFWCAYVYPPQDSSPSYH